MNPVVKKILLYITIINLFFSIEHSFSEEKLPTRIKPILIDQVNKRVLIYTEINLEKVNNYNPHWGIVYKHGRLGNKGIFKSYCSPEDFYDALIKIGAKPGNNLNDKSLGRFVEGDELKVTAIIKGDSKEYTLEEIIEDKSGKGFNIKFGGNINFANKENTGCITCLESCWVAITSNSNYPMISSWKRFFSPNSYFKGNSKVLPLKDEHPVILIYTLRH